MASENQQAILEARKNVQKVEKPAFGFSFEFNKSKINLVFEEEMKEILMQQFVVEVDGEKGELSAIVGPDEANDDVSRALASLELIANMVHPSLLQGFMSRAYVDQNLKSCSFGELTGRYMFIKTQVMNFGIYFAHHGKLKYHFFSSSQGNIENIDKVVKTVFETFKFFDPVEVLTPIIGETMVDYFDYDNNIKIRKPDSYELISSFPEEVVGGENVTVNNSSCVCEFKLIKKDYGMSFNIVLEKTKMKFSDFVELFKIQLIKSRVLLASVKETNIKLHGQQYVDFDFQVNERSHKKRLTIYDGQAVVISVEHFGCTPLKPERVIDSVLKSFKLFPRGIAMPKVENPYVHFEHFEKNFAISFPNHCQVLYFTSNVLVISLSKNPEDINGLFLQVLEMENPNQKVPSLTEINNELLKSFEKTCTIMYKQDPVEREFGLTCKVTEFNVDGTWFMNPIISHPHMNSVATIRVIQTPSFPVLCCYVNTKENFNRSWAQFGKTFMDSIRFY